MATPELGSKQICPNCSSKFYDLGKRPAVCPKCGESFDPEEALKSRRVRARSAVPDYETDDEKPAQTSKDEGDGFEDEADDTPEIDAADAAEPVETDEDGDDVAATPSGGDDLGVDFAEDEELADEEEADDVPFLEDEEDDFAEDEIDGIGGGDDDEDR